MFHEYNIFDAHGKQISHSIYNRRPKLGGGWVAFYKKALDQLLTECPNFSTMKVWLKLSRKQTFQKFVITTRKQIAKELKMDEKTVRMALKWLIANDYVQEHEVEGNSVFLLSPKRTSCGASSRKSRQELWDLQVQREEAEKLEIENNAKRELIAALDVMIADRLQDGFEEDDEENRSD